MKTRLSQSSFTAKAQQAMWSVDSDQSVFDFASYDQRVLDSIWQLSLLRVLLILFGLVALALAAIGIYGVMSYLVGQRTREMGICLALGASPADIRSLIFRHGILLATFGLSAGLAGAALLARMLRALVAGVSGGDAWSFGGAILVLIVVTILASALPAFRAARIDPAVALRDE